MARADTVVEAINPTDGPSAIENADDEKRCIPGLLDVLRTARLRPAGQRPDACVVACFGDPGLEEARAALDVPVLGIAQAAMHAAALVAGGFSVVTSMSATIERAWQLAEGYTTFCFKPSQYTDDPAEVPALCRRLVERAGQLAAA